MLSSPLHHQSGAALLAAPSPAPASAPVDGGLGGGGGGGGVGGAGSGAGGGWLLWLLSYRLSDLLFLLLGCLALLCTLRSAADYQLRVAWTAEGRGGGGPAEASEGGVASLVTDVDGDGVNGQARLQRGTAEHWQCSS